jgi:hypothetical protein
MVNRLRILVGLFVLLNCGCGVYTFSPGGKSSPKALSVERFENETAEMVLADRMTDLVMDAFIRDGKIKIVTPGNADAILTGTLTSYRRSPFEFDENDQVTSYSVVMTFQIALKNPDGETDIWSAPISQEGFYDVASETEEDAQEDAVDRLIDEIIARTTNPW